MVKEIKIERQSVQTYIYPYVAPLSIDAMTDPKIDEFLKSNLRDEAIYQVGHLHRLPGDRIALVDVQFSVEGDRLICRAIAEYQKESE